ncbi:MAG: Gfo/Idh/MocA family protein [Planctomycetota bacterium]|jgi:predicted dehydrogenase
MIKSKKLDVTIVGGGMIVHDQILPSIYHLQRIGVIGSISICDRVNRPIKTLAESEVFAEAFPGQTFTAYPSLDKAEDECCPEMTEEVLSKMAPRQMVVIAIPDQFHYDVIKLALKYNQHILCVKPLVLKYEQAIEVEKEAQEKGLFVGVEYHKRYDRRALLAKKEYSKGKFGEFKIGDARMIEPYLYRSSNFQNWFTCDQTDPFVYVGCHYVDQVYFLTGLKPISVSSTGVKGKFPNGNEGYMWANGRVTFENGAVLSVVTGLGYPDLGAGGNDQGLMMICEGEGKSGLIQHNDQDRGVQLCFLDGIGPGGSTYNYTSPDYFRLVPWEGDGFKPIGYGYDSIAASVETACRIEGEIDGMPENESIEKRRSIIKDIDDKGIIATPANSCVNELVVEAARMSILADGDVVNIVYGDKPHVEKR